MPIRTPSAQIQSDNSDPLVTYTAYKLRRSTIEKLEKSARKLGWSTAALVRDVLETWANRQGRKVK
jgi:hypothetical protein